MVRASRQRRGSWARDTEVAHYRNSGSEVPHYRNSGNSGNIAAEWRDVVNCAREEEIHAIAKSLADLDGRAGSDPVPSRVHRAAGRDNGPGSFDRPGELS